MTNADETLEDEYAEFDAFDEEEEDESGLSGFSVLMIGLVMFGAFAAITWIAYQQGVKRGEDGAGAPYVAADPEPIKIENEAEEPEVAAREVYDVFDGEAPEPVTVIAEAPEEPVDRNPEDPIGAIADEAERVAREASEALETRLASAETDARDALNAAPPAVETAPEPEPEPARPDPAPARPATAPTPASAATADIADLSAISGSHVVQVGAFRSNEEAMAMWGRMRAKLGESVIGAKTFHVERADLGDKGVYHRLRIGPFSDKSAAADYCQTLKANGQDCLAKGV